MFVPAQPLEFDPQLCWRYVPIRGGESLTGWVAGQPVGIQSHHDDFTKPCRAWISGGKLPCWREHTCVTRFVSYLPLYTNPEEEKIVVILSRTTALKVPPALMTGVPVTVSRPKGKNNPPIRLNWDRSACPERVTQKMNKRTPADIKPYLLHLWQDEAICKHCGTDFIPSRATSEKANVVKMSDATLAKMGS